MAYTFGKTYYFKSNAGYGRYMNVYGSETVADSRNVCLYDKENIGAQKWIIRQESGYGKIYTSLAGGNTFALNLHSESSKNCTMYRAAGNDKDSLVDLLTVNAAQNIYRVKLKNYNLYLVAETSANLGNVAWKALTDSDSFLWKLEEEGYVPPVPAPTPVPSAIANQTFFVKNANTGVYLNVNGYDTVAQSTNVNVYNKTDCQAQRWVARQTATGGKLFTKIDEAFALNIYNDNCTMYIASGNDDDSLLEFIPYDTAQRIYRIKMFRKNKYLSSAAASSGSNAVWVDNINANDYTLWKFETEAEAFPSGPPVPSAIANQTFFVKNYNTGSFLNVHGYDTVANSTNVNVYGFEDCQAQRWVAKQTTRGGKLFTKINDAFALNIHNDNCTMYTAQGYDDDTLLEFVPFDVAQKIYRIKLVNHNKYLTVANVDKGANALWTTNMYDNTLWKFETEDEARPQVPAVPTALVNKTFFIKDNTSGLYLNVYGTDTVSNTRNVNIYEAEDCLAQRWVARQTAQGGKLHTKIDEAFALNIHVEAKNNCTMYNAQASGDDSVLEFSPYNSSANEYLIKMFHKDKYLTVATDDRGANVYWSDINDGSAVWTFVDESDVIFAPSVPGEMFSKDSSLVTKVMPAHQNNFTKNRAEENAAIEKITIHHMAGNLSIETLGSIWQKPDRRGSSHYGINGNKVGQYVKESDIAWTDGNWESNRRSVTIETANSTGDPTWEIAGATYQTVIKLVADIARRNNFGTLVKGKNVTWHSMYSATQCPGPDLLRLMDSIVNEANRINAETPVDPEPPVPPSHTYEYGAVRHPETGKIYRIFLQENFKEYIDPPYQLVDTRTYSMTEVDLLGILVSTAADDMFLDKYYSNLGGYGLVAGALTAINQSVSATRITVNYYEYNNIYIARIYCQDSSIDSVFQNMLSLAYPPSFKDAAKEYAGIFYNESEVNTYCKNLYEKVTGLVGNDDYKYDIEYVFNETRRAGNNYTGLVASKDKELYEYFFIRPGEKTNIVIKKSPLESQKIDVTKKISYFSKVDFDILSDFNIGTIE